MKKGEVVVQRATTELEQQLFPEDYVQPDLRFRCADEDQKHLPLPAIATDPSAVPVADTTVNTVDDKALENYGECPSSPNSVESGFIPRRQKY
jgi:hypothetical protein